MKGLQLLNDSYATGWGSAFSIYQDNSGTAHIFDTTNGDAINITPSGNVGIGRNSDGSWQLEVQGNGNQHGIFGQAGAAAYWGIGGYSNDGTAYGGLGVGNSYGVYGNSANSYAVYGASTNNWGGVFTGADGVYGQSTTGWAGQFYTTNSQNGVSIGNPSNNAQLCLNGTDAAHCITSLTTNLVEDYYSTDNNMGSGYSTTNLGTHALCVLSHISCASDCSFSLVITGGVPGAYTWELENGGNNIGAICFN